ncbi:MAG: hypothetical protein LBC73_04330 [Oscillospiraceae bacterium]|jgi:hypothetical protein|nr:hypothetical protein [Oscillospiraceae bacterium]
MRRYVPNTYYNGRFRRAIIGAVATVALSIVLLFLILFFIFSNYVDEDTGELVIPGLIGEATPTPNNDDDNGNNDDGDDGGDE